MDSDDLNDAAPPASPDESSDLDAELDVLEPGVEIGGHRIIERIGSGGMGVVYKALHVALDRTVALKILPKPLAANSTVVGQLEREAKAAAKLDHANVVRAVDAGKDGDRFYFAMEYVDGASLHTILRERGRLPEEEALSLAIQVARGLECAWQGGLVHRDIKPGNILVNTKGIAKIADLGLAIKPQTDPEDTQGAVGMGTPQYISPEQVHGQSVDIRTDIYALGATLYRMVTGVHAFTGDDPISIIMARFEHPPNPANEACPEVSDELAQLIATMMSLDPDHRHPDPGVLIHDLELVAAGERPAFAGAPAKDRERAAAAVKIRQAVKRASRPVIVRRRIPQGLIIVGAGAAIALVMATLALVFRGGSTNTQVDDLRAAGDALIAELTEDLNEGRAAELVDKVNQSIDTYAGTPHARELAKLRARASSALLDEEAGTFLRSAKAAFEAGNYAAVVKEISDAGGRYTYTSHNAALRSLHSEASAQLEQAQRQKTAELERERRYDELVKLARTELEIGDYAHALNLLVQARAIKNTDAVDGLFAEAARSQRIASAKEAEQSGRLADALRYYRSALDSKDDPRLREHVAELARTVALEEKSAEAQRLARAGKLDLALGAFREALQLAGDGEGAAIRKRIGELESEIASIDVPEEGREPLTDISKQPVPIETREVAAQPQPNLDPPDRIIDSIGLELVLVPAGDFTMGSDDGPDDERPARILKAEAYYISVHEITNAQYELFRPERRLKRLQYSPDDLTPAIAVAWEDAAAFCIWLSDKEGVEYRLPTEAQWEKAARGPEGRTYPWGDEFHEEGQEYRCNLAPSRDRAQWAIDGFEFAAPVGAFPGGVSPYGCHDMAGNVWEWCLDRYNPQGYRPEAEALNGARRVVRGGSFLNGVETLRSSNRRDVPADFLEANIGFRCVRTARSSIADGLSQGKEPK